MERYDYSGFKLSKLKTKQFKHLFLLLYWPVYGLFFLILERFTTTDYHIMFSPLDKYIPFCEYFVFPYLAWFPFMLWVVVYAFFFDVEAFKKYSYYVIITYSVAVLTYIVYPSCQQLRPDVFPRDNFSTDIVAFLYLIDTPTDVFPSVHVIGSLSTLFTAWHSKRYSTALWRTAFVIMTVIICMSTLFLKQHSVVDIIAGAVLSFAVYPFVYILPDRRKKHKGE